MSYTNNLNKAKIGFFYLYNYFTDGHDVIPMSWIHFLTTSFVFCYCHYEINNNNTSLSKKVENL